MLVEVFDLTEIEAKLQHLPGWRLDGKELVRIVVFKDFAEALKYVNLVGAISEEADHHPKIVIEWNKVTLLLRTHSKDAITNLDIALAERVESIKF